MRGRLNTLLGRLLIGSAIPLVLFALVGIVSWVAMARLLGALQLEKHTHEVISDALQMHQHLDAMRYRAEVIPLGPPLTADERFRAARRGFQSLGTKLSKMVVGNETQRQRLAEALAKEERLADKLAQPGRPFDDAAARQFTEVEDLLKAFTARERELLAGRHEHAVQATNEAWPVIGTAAAVALVLTVLLSLTAARSVTRPVRKLREGAGLLVSGKFRSIPPQGPTEIAELIVLFNHVALTLTERTSLLAREEERYRTYIGAVSHILWTTDPRGEVTGDLPSWRAYTGQSEDEVRGLGLWAAVHPDDRPAAEEAWRRAIERAEPFDVELRLRSACGEYRPFACRAVVIMSPDGSVREWVGTCTDITEARERAALQQAKESAEAASRAKSEFLTRMSHELRTPLNAVIGMSKMLATQHFGPLNVKQADYLADITRAGEHLLALINDILDLAKVEAGKMDVQAEAFGIAAAVEALVSTLRPLVGTKGVALVIDADAGDSEMNTDAARFRQVLYNLLSNAIKFTPQGHVRVGWQWVAAAALDAPAVPAADAPAVRVSVQDTGVGIAPEDQATVWDEFRQVRAAQADAPQGTGLGLALTRRLVGLLGGEIALKSVPGEGSTFTFCLPRRLPQAPAETSPVADGRPVALVVEDHGPTNKLLCDWLNGAGLRAVSALDGETGLAQARALRPALIMLDIQLPKLDGWQVLTELKSDPATAAIPVVIVTMTEDRQPAGAFGVQEYFIKPVEREVLLGRLRELQPRLFPATPGLRVLVVDDDPLARKLVSDALRAEGAEVREVANGRQALDEIDRQRPDLVVLDLLLPEVDGFGVVEQVRARPELANLPILVVTAKDLDAEDRQRLQGRAQALLQQGRLTAAGLHEHLRALGVVRREG